MLVLAFAAIYSCDKATYYDQIQNGNETGVDCGGSDCSPCPIAGQVTGGICNPTVYQDVAWIYYDGTPFKEARVTLATPTKTLVAEAVGIEALVHLSNSDLCEPDTLGFPPVSCLDSTYVAAYTNDISIDTSLIQYEHLSAQQFDASAVGFPSLIVEGILEAGGLIEPDHSFNYSILVEVERCNFNLAIRLGSTFVSTPEFYILNPTLAASFDAAGGLVHILGPSNHFIRANLY